MGKGFDEYAPAYDAWFLENRNVLYSEINLVAHVLKNPASNRRKEWPKSPASGG